MKKTEYFFAIMIVLSIIMKSLHLQGADLMAIVGFSLASIYYYAFTAFILNDIQLKDVFKKESYQGIHPVKLIASIALGWDFSILILGVFFKFMIFPGGELMLTYGLITLTVFFLLYSVFFKMKKTDYYKQGLYRIAAIGIIGLLMFKLPIDFIIDNRYSEHPEYAKAIKECYESPNDSTAIFNRDSIFMATYGHHESE